MSVNPDSPTWKAVEAWAKAELESARDRLEIYRDMRDIALEQGRVNQCRDLLSLAEKARTAAAQEGQPAKPFTPNDYA